MGLQVELGMSHDRSPSYGDWLHAQRFRTEMCQDGAACQHPLCVYAHSLSELQASEIQKSIQNPQQHQAPLDSPFALCTPPPVAPQTKTPSLGSPSQASAEIASLRHSLSQLGSGSTGRSGGSVAGMDMRQAGEPGTGDGASASGSLSRPATPSDPQTSGPNTPTGALGHPEGGHPATGTSSVDLYGTHGLQIPNRHSADAMNSTSWGSAPNPGLSFHPFEQEAAQGRAGQGSWAGEVALAGGQGLSPKTPSSSQAAYLAGLASLQDQMLREQAAQAEAPGSAAMAALQGSVGAAQPPSPTDAANSAAIAAIQRQAQLQLMATQHKEQQHLAAQQAGAQPWPTQVHPSQLHLLQAAQQQAAAQQAAQQALQQHQQGHSLPDLHNAGRQSQLLALLKEKQQAQAQQQLAALQQQRQHAATAAASIGGGAAGQTLAPTALGQPASPKGLPSAGSPGPGMGSSLGGAAVAGGGGVGSGSIDDIAVYVAAIKEVMASEDINKPQVLQQLSIVLKQAVQARHLEQRSNRLHLAQQQQQKLQQAAHLQQQQAHSAIKGQAAAATALHSKPVLGHTIQQQQAMAQAQNAALVSNPQVQQQLKQLATQQQQGMQGLNALRNTTANPQVAVAAAAAAASALNESANDARGQGVPLYEGAGGSLPAHPLQVSAAQLLEATAAKHGITLGRSPGHVPDVLPQATPSHLNYDNFQGMGQPQQLSAEQVPRFPQGLDQPQAEQRGGGLVHQSTLPIHIIRQLQSQAVQQQRQQQPGPGLGLASARSLSDPNLFQTGRNAEAALDPRQDVTAQQGSNSGGDGGGRRGHLFRHSMPRMGDTNTTTAFGNLNLKDIANSLGSSTSRRTSPPPPSPFAGAPAFNQDNQSSFQDTSSAGGGQDPVVSGFNRLSPDLPASAIGSHRIHRSTFASAIGSHRTRRARDDAAVGESRPASTMSRQRSSSCEPAPRQHRLF